MREMLRSKRKILNERRDELLRTKRAKDEAVEKEKAKGKATTTPTSDAKPKEMREMLNYNRHAKRTRGRYVLPTSAVARIRP